jgi:epoxyqueuosine reductase
VNPLHSLDCGECQECLLACPTGAIEKSYSINAQKCLSYLTIEHRGLVDKKYLKHFSETIFGCDICQDVCPYNMVADYFEILEDFKEKNKYLMSITARELASMDYDDYIKWLGGTAMTRAKYGGLIRNALYHLYATKDRELQSILSQLENHKERLVRDVVKQLRDF